MTTLFNPLATVFLERLRDAARAATQGHWRPGKSSGSVVTDVAHAPPEFIVGADEILYYGGHLVCESIRGANAAFVSMLCPPVALALVEALLRETTLSMSLEQARVIRTWVVELACSSAHVGELAANVWGGEGDPEAGRRLVREAEALLGERFPGDPA